MSGGKVPDFPQTRLAFRSWQLDRPAMMVRSLNATSGRKQSWIAKAMASPEGNWPHGAPLTAACMAASVKRVKAKDEEEHGPVPSPECSCGIYATIDLDVINGYLSRSAPVLGVVELGGRVIPASNGYRAQVARVAAFLLLDDALTESRALLRELADAYRVPALVPHSADPEDYRDLIGAPTVAAEAEAYLRRVEGDAA